MQKLFVEEVCGEKIVLNEEQSRHIAKSLRMKKGDMITICNSKGSDFGCIIEETMPSVVLKVCYEQATESEPSVKVHLYQCLPKGDKMDGVIKKCTELGTYCFTPVLSKRCVSRPDKKSLLKKIQRYNKISLEASQQSGRGIVPVVNECVNFKDAVLNCREDVKIIFYEGGGERLCNLVEKDTKSVAVFIGSEGGFEKEEVDFAVEHGFVNATLGKRILRTQTAPVCAVSVIMSLTDNI